MLGPVARGLPVGTPLAVRCTPEGADRETRRPSDDGVCCVSGPESAADASDAFVTSPPSHGDTGQYFYSLLCMV